MLANFAETWLPILLGLSALAFVGGLGFFIVKGYRWFTAAAERAQMRAYEGVPVSELPGPGLVLVVFHTYSGLLVFTNQVEHRFWAMPDDARLLLSRLNLFNLTWGFFAYGGLVIPVLSLGNYWAERARISKQTASPEG